MSIVESCDEQSHDISYVVFQTIHQFLTGLTINLT